MRHGESGGGAYRSVGRLRLAMGGCLAWLGAASVWAQAPGGLPPAPVVAEAVVEREAASSQMFVGTVLPRYKATIGSAVSGRVIEVLVEEGDRVSAGQPLVQILTETIQLELAGAEAELELRRQELAELRNGAREEELLQAKAAMLAAEARQAYFSMRRDRTIALYRNGRATSEEDRDEAISAATAAEQTYLEAKAVYDLAVAGTRHERIAQAEARVAIQAAIVDRLRDQIKKHTIISRLDGYVTSKATEKGAWVTQGDEVIEVVAVDEVEIEAAVVEQHVPFVRVGAEVAVELPALPQPFHLGTVRAVVPQGDARARTFPVKVLVPNVLDAEGPQIKPGMLARVILATGPKRRGLFVPKDAVVFAGAEPLVYVVQPAAGASQTTTVRPVTVVLGASLDGQFHVEGDLRAGDLVVTEGNERLRPGQTVQRLTQPAEAQAASTAPASPDDGTEELR